VSGYSETAITDHNCLKKLVQAIFVYEVFESSDQLFTSNLDFMTLGDVSTHFCLWNRTLSSCVQYVVHAFRILKR